MSQNQFVVTVEPNEAVLRMAGDLTGSAESDLLQAWQQLSHAETIILDFADVNYMNSTGIALLVEMLKMALSAEKQLIARHLNDHYREIFHITQLSTYIPIVS